MKRRENALKRVRDAFTRDRDHDAPCPAQSLTMRWLADMRKGWLRPGDALFAANAAELKALRQ
jgi:hypothetical protein